jgi:hypothetical protein
MKHTIRWVLVTVLASAVFSCITYNIAYRKAFLSGQVHMIHLNSQVTSHLLGGALREIRSGDMAGATRLLETFYFGAAENFFHAPGTANETEAKKLAKELVQYRSTYRTNSADWDVIEQKLEKELANVK